MKTVSYKDKIIRVSDAEADAKVSVGWMFVPKSVWKEKVRDIKENKSPPLNETKEVSTDKKTRKPRKKSES